MNPTPHIIESALLLLAAFMIGCLIGFAVKRVFGRKSSATRANSAAPGEHASGDPALGLLTTPQGQADDLKKIKGIGPKVESVLNENGVFHYRQIAAWDARAIAMMNARLSFKGRIEREKWVSQAKVLDKATSR